MTADIDLEALGQLAEGTSDLSVSHARKVAAVLDVPLALCAGDPLPLLWHWAFFTPDATTSALGVDGHPLLPEGGPTAGLPRRMWVGGRVRAHADLRLGTPARRMSRVLSAERKVGQSGALLVVTLEHQILQNDQLVRTEEQDLVYRAPEVAGVPRSPVAKPEQRPPLPASDWAEVVEPNPVMLFRFSAVTFNSHRIHYDLPYAVEVEGYQDLVVHGPLTALLLFHAADRRRSVDASAFDFRATAPIFVGSPIMLSGCASGDGHIDLRALRSDETVSMTALLK